MKIPTLEMLPQSGFANRRAFLMKVVVERYYKHTAGFSDVYLGDGSGRDAAPGQQAVVVQPPAPDVQLP